MSSYADAAASLGPTGHPKKIPEPTKVAETTEPRGSVETVDAKEFERAKKQASKAAEDAVRAGKEQAKHLKKELKELEEDAKPYVEKFVGYVKEQYAYLTNYVASIGNSDVVKTAGEELQNPVVVGQLAVIAAGATAGWFVLSEKARIRLDNKYVVAIHAGVITALVLGDAYVFQQLYPKYKK